MQKHELPVQKTAQIFTLGDVQSATEVWIVLHGYAQLARTFLETFEQIASKDCAIIAPEGLHRFYKKGFYGDVVASWMTKEDRLNDIEDYSKYLDSVLNKFTKTGQTIRVFGFSQGVATACRWISQSDSKISSLILWAGTFPTDISMKNDGSSLPFSACYLAYDPEDKFRNEDSWNKQLNFIGDAGIKPTIFTYTGGHTIPGEALEKFNTQVLR
jgi:predicted esterase